MPSEALAYIKKNRLCVLAVEMPDGAPHAATVHYATTDDTTPVFLFETHKEYRKAEALYHRDSSRASLVIGVAEGPDHRTLQMDGEVSLIDSDDPRRVSVYLAKFSEKSAKLQKPNVIMFQFKPTWWRFTDSDGSGGRMLYTSDQT